MAETSDMAAYVLILSGFLKQLFFSYSYINVFTIDTLMKEKKTKTKIYKTIIRCKATVAPKLKLKEEQLQNQWFIHGLNLFNY